MRNYHMRRNCIICSQAVADDAEAAAVAEEHGNPLPNKHKINT